MFSSPPTPETPNVSTPTKDTTPPLHPPTDLWEPEEGRKTYVAPLLPSFRPEEYMGEYMFLAECGQVRDKFLTHGPEEVQEMDEPEQLHRLADLYSPSDQPRTFYEAAYLDMMQMCISLRLTDLALF